MSLSSIIIASYHLFYDFAGLYCVFEKMLCTGNR
jgi:hypothetical protein